MRDRAYESYLRDCVALNVRPVAEGVFRIYYGTIDHVVRVDDPQPISYEYAEYLTSVRGLWGPHVCQHNVPRTSVDHDHSVWLDGSCKCDPDQLYTQSDHRDWWRRWQVPVSQDFPGEYYGNDKPLWRWPGMNAA